MRDGFVTALGLGVLVFILSILPVTTVSTQPAQSQAQANCEARGANYRYLPQTGGCMKIISKTKPPPVVIPGGDAEAAKASPEQEACENRGGKWRWNPEAKQCVKVIGKCDPGSRSRSRCLYQDQRIIWF